MRDSWNDYQKCCRGDVRPLLDIIAEIERNPRPLRYREGTLLRQLKSLWGYIKLKLKGEENE